MTLMLALLCGAVAVPADEVEAGMEKKNIVETAVEAGQFNTLAKALQVAGLVDALQGEGPFTVFAPTDEAFAKLPKGTLESLIAQPEQLKQILLYHVVSGSVKAEQVVGLSSAKTLQGSAIEINVTDAGVMVDGAKVVKTDIVTSNGIIHVIDNVIVPAKG